MEKSAAIAASMTAAPTEVQRPRELPRRWSGGHIKALDGLRGCAVLAVMFYHFMAPELTAHAHGGLVLWLQKASAVGWCGVDLFFVLSGFLITGILLDAKGSQTYFKSFYVRRILRIFPLYFGVITAAFIGSHIRAVSDLFGFEDVTASFAWLYAFLSNVYVSIHHNKNAFGPMGHFWSLAVEEHFYMIWPALVYLCSRRQLAVACAVMVVGALALRCGLALAYPVNYASYMLTPCRVDGLALGGLLAMIVRSHLDVTVIRRWAGVVASFCFVLILLLGFRDSRSGGFSHYGRAMTTAGFTLFTFFFTSVIALAVSGKSGAWGRRLTENAVLMSVGKYSFAMYILHLLFLRPFSRLFPIDRLSHLLHWADGGLLCFAVLSMVSTYLLAWLSWTLYEQNFLRLKRFFPY